MSGNLMVLERQAISQNFSFGTTAASGEGKITVNKGNGAATASLGLDIKNSGQVLGDFYVGGNFTYAGTINKTLVTDTEIADVNIKVNVGGLDATAEGAGLQVEGTGAALRGGITYAVASATKWQVGDGTTQQDIVGLTATQALTGKTYNGATITTCTGTLTLSTFTLTVTATASVSGTNTGDETVTTSGALILGAASKATPVDTDYIGLMDSAASNILKKLSWLNLKATLKTYFDTLYAPVSSKYFHPNTITGTQDGLNPDFVIGTAFDAGTAMIFKNGQKMLIGVSNNYTISGVNVTWLSNATSFLPVSTDNLEVWANY